MTPRAIYEQDMVRTHFSLRNKLKDPHFILRLYDKPPKFTIYLDNILYSNLSIVFSNAETNHFLFFSSSKKQKRSHTF